MLLAILVKKASFELDNNLWKDQQLCSVQRISDSENEIPNEATMPSSIPSESQGTAPERRRKEQYKGDKMSNALKC